ncbi:uncharacterized protein OCT59_024458 [Rhizophagus irregularis]|uniref:Protein kinase domain-containing protein n=1 Tax=Rhizophagus irregularis (strain DAOM 197198w) TaxID=1432141 RepID=A0A015K343_RHIIW|nr:hypothetical protein RirG_240060 [Rhizophagus irregularis DAOM 197198w]UZO04059.1 hypothetical protein OCT59_024458 [Rhizophagus irregularis]
MDKSSTEILLNEKYYIIKERTSKNNYIKNIIYDKFLESIPFDRFEDIKQIGEGGIVKAYSETWIDGKANYIKQHDESLKRRVFEPMKFVLKRFQWIS